MQHDLRLVFKEVNKICKYLIDIYYRMAEIQATFTKPDHFITIKKSPSNIKRQILLSYEHHQKILYLTGRRYLLVTEKNIFNCDIQNINNIFSVSQNDFE